MHFVNTLMHSVTNFFLLKINKKIKIRNAVKKALQTADAFTHLLLNMISNITGIKTANDLLNVSLEFHS